MKLFWILCIVLAALFLLWLYMMAPRLKRPPLMKKLMSYRFAHRGLHAISKGVPENSLLAFRLAAEEGYAIELDVHLAKSGELVVEHDDSLLRTCGIDRAIEDCSWEEIQQLTLEGTQEKLPLLREVFDLIDGRVPLLIEAKAYKGNQTALAKAVYTAMKEYRGESCMESFDPRVVLWFRKHAPEVVRGQLSGYLRKSGAKLHPILDFAMRNLLVNVLSRPDFVAYDHRNHRGPAFRLCRAIFRPPVFFWTVKSVEGENLSKALRATPIFEQILE